MSESAMKSDKVVRLPIKRQWKTAKQTGLTADWPAYQRPVDVDIRFGLAAIRARARELAQNSDHAKGFLRIVRNNIVGKPGFVLQSRAQQRNGKPDARIREQIEGAWKGWGRRGVCEITGKYSWRGLQRHVVETVARDGEAVVRKIRGAGNDYGFMLQLIDPETLDVQLNGEVNGRQVRMGVEIDDLRRPVAYHLLGESPINAGSYRTGTDRFRVPAEEIIHVYLPEFCWQTRGVSWLAAAAGRMNMIIGTEDAEVTAARASAARFAAYEAKEWASPPEPAQPGLVDAEGNPISSTDPGAFAQDIAPGAMEIVPYGYELKYLASEHPNAQMPDFLKWALRSVSTGLGVSYNTLGNDAEGVNYTSLRFFLGVERDNWMEMQDWYQDDFIDPVFRDWVQSQLDLGTEQITPRPGRESQAFDIHWQPRRWEGPDPSKQAQADETDLRNGTSTLTEILARKGRDFDDVIAERIREIGTIKQAAEAAGLTLSDVMPYVGTGQPSGGEQPQTTDQNDDQAV